ncbi:hypothetical protein B9Z19DRAFT_1075251 [Tuber borchii]|uniref:Uncharacterized protein n=1 Tax=Tuber borchii TaxID=42251 RepID=A0A2T7A3L3_TUBBO|nr:hypothetical protein B9Z19DRAFT_1075251 [Tuber borchii]
MYIPMSPLVSYTFVHALVCPLVHTSVLLHTIALPVICAPRYTTNTTFYYWDYIVLGQRPSFVAPSTAKNTPKQAKSLDFEIPISTPTS